MKRKTFVAATGAALAGIGLPHTAAAKGSRDLIVYGATIHTVDSAHGNPEAFVVRGGRFAYVGSLRGAEAFAARGAERLALHGMTVLPGLADAHIHLQSVGLDLNEINLHHIDSFEEVVRQTAAFARQTPDEWVMGQGWDQNLWPGRQFPAHDALSAAVPEKPVVLERVDGHALLANARAMQLAGVTASTPDPQGGRIIREANGAPTGVFVDNAMDVIYRVVPPPTPAQLLRATKAAIAQAHRYGLTSIAQPGIGNDGITAYEQLARGDELTLRSYLMLSDDASLIEEHLPRGPRSAEYGGRLWLRTIKMFADGALGSRGAALLAPYSDDPSNMGLHRITQAHVFEVAEKALHHGFQVATHAIGDGANRIVLDAYQAALKMAPRGDYRFRTEHAQVLSPQDIPRFAQLGVIPSMQTTHQISDMGWAEKRLGADRIKGAYAWRSLLNTGVVIPNGTDAPVEEVSTLRTFHAAISRQNKQNEPPGGWYPDQRMTRDEALRSMTIWAAHANFQERILGSITPGRYADFVVMDRDWMRVPASEVMNTRIAATYFNGERVYDGSAAGASRVSVRGIRSRLQGCCCRTA